MSIINQAAREICAKIVYYGPGLSGKTTTLRRVFESIRPSNRGEMISLATEGDRTLFFDFLPVRVERVGDCTVRLALYTVPGQVFYNATRKLVLHQADGVVFVADSHPGAMDSNLESLANLRENLRDQGCDFANFPLVIQYNKRDLPDALPVEILRKRLNPRGVPDFETVAAEGKGILDALRAITRSVLRSLKAKGVVLRKPARKAPAVPTLEKQDGPSLASQLEAAASLAPSVPEGNLVALLVPSEIVDEAVAAEADFRAGRYPEAFARSLAALRSVTSGMGAAGASPVELALMAGLTGPDYARLVKIEQSGSAGREDAAFGLLMLGLSGVRSGR